MHDVDEEAAQIPRHSLAADATVVELSGLPQVDAGHDVVVVNAPGLSTFNMSDSTFALVEAEYARARHFVAGTLARLALELLAPITMAGRSHGCEQRIPWDESGSDEDEFNALREFARFNETVWAQWGERYDLADGCGLNFTSISQPTAELDWGLAPTLVLKVPTGQIAQWADLTRRAYRHLVSGVGS